MNKDEASKLYEGKFFYEVARDNREPHKVILFGPLDNIRYVVNMPQGDNNPYKFVQIIDGKPAQAFKADEILVVDRRL